MDMSKQERRKEEVLSGGLGADIVRSSPRKMRTTSDAGVTGGVTIPNSGSSRQDLFRRRHLDSSSDSDEEDDVNGATTSTSYFRPRSLAAYAQYLETVHMEGVLEKQSLDDPSTYKRRWFVMHEQDLFYYKSSSDIVEKKPSDDKCCNVIRLEDIDSVTTAKDFGPSAFQIRLESRRYVLRAESKDRMQEWLFNFQKSIAIIISALARTHHYEFKSGRLVRAGSMPRANRSLSLDYPEYLPTFNSKTLEEYYRTHASPEAPGDASRRASSPVSGPKSPLSSIGMFSFDPLDDVDTTEVTEVPDASPPKYVPRFLRNRQAAVATSPPKEEKPKGRWVPRHQREGAKMSPSESFEVDIPDELAPFQDHLSYSTGEEMYGATSLVGVRSSMEDVICCLPDLDTKVHMDVGQKQQLYALFDGHSGVRAAAFSSQRIATYLSEQPTFISDVHQAFHDCFKRIDDEFLDVAKAEDLIDGTTAAVVLLRGNRMYTANVGDCRAVVSLGGQAMDVIEEQTPGRTDERERIEKHGGWVQAERELHMSKLYSMDLRDPEIQQRAERVVQWVNIYRVNGELGVSRAIGDMDYKGEALNAYEYWAFPDGHSKEFTGDLVISTPETQEMEVTPEVEFLILACDGLWDTITSKEAVAHVRSKLLEGLSPQRVSHSLGKLAIRSGSSDNVSVVVVVLNAIRG